MKKGSSKSHPSDGPTPPPPFSVKDRFRRLSYQTACYLGSPAAFLTACLLIVVWALTGPYFHFADSWQLVVNTATTIITFLMVFLIQNTQNRDAKAIHLKLDELIRAAKGARNSFVLLQEFGDEELARLEQEFARLKDRSGRSPGKEKVVRPEPSHCASS